MGSVGFNNVRIIAHRGASARAPENTLAAFALARRMGAHALELDARACGSGEIVVFHDRDLARLTGARGEVRKTPLAELRKLSVAGTSERIPTLEDVLRSDDRPPGLVIEMKTDRWHDLSIARKVADLVERTRAAEHGPITISSFNPLTLARLRKVAPQLPRALLAEKAGSRPRRNLWFVRPVAPRELHLEWPLISADLIARARRAGRFVVAWTVNDTALGARLEAMGVDGLITDVPEAFLAIDGGPARS